MTDDTTNNVDPLSTTADTDFLVEQEEQQLRQQLDAIASAITVHITSDPAMEDVDFDDDHVRQAIKIIAQFFFDDGICDKQADTDECGEMARLLFRFLIRTREELHLHYEASPEEIDRMVTHYANIIAETALFGGTTRDADYS